MQNRIVWCEKSKGKSATFPVDGYEKRILGFLMENQGEAFTSRELHDRAIRGKEKMCDFVAKNCESLLRLVKTKSTISMNRGRVSLSKPEALDLSREVRKTTESYLYAIAVPFYGGEIKCKSKVGAGTEFTVTLPLRSRYTAGWVSGGCVGLLPQRFGSSAPCHGSYRPCWG